MALYLRSVNAQRQSYGGFQWPSEVGAVVIAPDWNPEPVCGGGLHGLLWGQGDTNLLCLDVDTIFQVVEYEGEAIDIGGKYKFPSCTLVFEGTREKAAEYLAECAPRDVAIPFLLATAGDYGTATAGYRGTATAGNRGTATAGHGGTATAGHGGTATAGHGGTATAGDRGILQIYWFDGKRSRIAVAYAGEEGILANRAYKLDCDGRFVLVDKEDI